MYRANFSRKKLIIIAVVIVVAIIIGLLLWNARGSKPLIDTPTKTTVTQGTTVTPADIGQDAGSRSPTYASSLPSTEELSAVISQSNAIAPSSGGQPDFGITKVTQPLPGWYVVTIQKNGLEPAKVILRETGNSDNPLIIIAGPGTSFPADTVSLPDAVRKAT